MRWAWFGLGVVAVLAILLVGVWIAGEMRYRSCIEAADLRYPVAYEQPGERVGYRPPEGRFDYEDRGERSRAIDNCSRLP